MNIALELAAKLKASGTDIADDLWSQEYAHLTDGQWNSACEEAEKILPSIGSAHPLVKAEKREMCREYRAEQLASRYLCFSE